jgi:hypothetical protein
VPLGPQESLEMETENALTSLVECLYIGVRVNPVAIL